MLISSAIQTGRIPLNGLIFFVLFLPKFKYFRIWKKKKLKRNVNIEVNEEKEWGRGRKMNTLIMKLDKTQIICGS